MVLATKASSASERGRDLTSLPPGPPPLSQGTAHRPAGEGWGLGGRGQRGGHSRQSASSVWSSQSKSPSQRQSLRAQCPFPQGNSLGSQGGVGPGGAPGQGSARGLRGLSPAPTTGPLPRAPAWPRTAVRFIAAIGAVLLPVAHVVFGDAVPAVTRGLMRPTGHRPAWAGQCGLGGWGGWALLGGE